MKYLTLRKPQKFTLFQLILRFFTIVDCHLIGFGFFSNCSVSNPLIFTEQMKFRLKTRNLIYQMWFRFFLKLENVQTHQENFYLTVLKPQNLIDFFFLQFDNVCDGIIWELGAMIFLVFLWGIVVLVSDVSALKWLKWTLRRLISNYDYNYHKPIQHPKNLNLKFPAIFFSFLIFFWNAKIATRHKVIWIRFRQKFLRSKILDKQIEFYFTFKDGFVTGFSLK